MFVRNQDSSERIYDQFNNDLTPLKVDSYSMMNDKKVQIIKIPKDNDQNLQKSVDKSRNGSYRPSPNSYREMPKQNEFAVPKASTNLSNSFVLEKQNMTTEIELK